MPGINYSNAIPLIAMAVSLLAACHSRPPGPPEIAVDRTACSHCGMFVSEPIYAAAYHVEGSEPKVFDDIACLLESRRRESLSADGSGVRLWFHDEVHGLREVLRREAFADAFHPACTTAHEHGHVCPELQS